MHPTLDRATRALLLSVLLPLLSFGLTTGCARSARSAAAPTGERTTLRVENRGWSDMTIYVLRGGQRIRLGLVPGVSTRIFELPRSVVPSATTVSFLADPVGSSRTPVSEEITVRPGDQVELLIPQ